MNISAAASPIQPHPIASTLRRLHINLQRVIDHLWRLSMGLPLVRRSLITPDVFLGGQYQLRSIGRLKEQGVTGVINMRMHSIHSTVIEGLEVLHLPTPDRTAPSPEHLAQGVAFAQRQIEQGGKVYIHCQWGEGRGPTMAIAYLIATGLTLDDAIAHVKQVRTFIAPTAVQLEALRKFAEVTAAQKQK